MEMLELSDETSHTSIQIDEFHSESKIPIEIHQ